jgi:hypothetical protein
MRKRGRGAKTIFLVLESALSLGIAASSLIAGGEPSPVKKLEVSLSRIARITSDASGSYDFFRVAAAPDDARRAMICAQHLSLITNEFSVEVFSSADEGETWNLRLVDASGHETSEDACAFGESGKAYFVAQPWNVKDPYAPHVSMGESEMHLYRSSSYAESWPAFLVTPFVDYARIAVDSWPESPFRGRAYIVGNRTATEDFPLYAVLGGGKQLIGATKQLESFPKSDGVQYPRSLIVLESGEVLASYLSGRKTSGGMSYSAIVTASRDGGKTLEAPVTIEKDVCPNVGVPSVAEVPRSGTVVAFYAGKNGSSCLLTLASSHDKGQTWKRLPISLQDMTKSLGDGTVQPGSITFRTDGNALLTWAVNKTVYGCVLGPTWQPLWFGEISSNGVGEGVNVAPYVRGDDRLQGGAGADMDISLQFGFQNYEEIDSVLQADSAFLVVWRQDDGQLYSRSIRLVLPASSKVLTIEPNRDVTALVRYEAKNITFDTNTNTFEYDLALLNASETPLTGPFLLKIKEVKTTVGPVTLKDVQPNEIVFVGERSAALLQGEHTSAVRMRIQASPEVIEKITSPSIDARVGIIGRVYAGSP